MFIKRKMKIKGMLKGLTLHKIQRSIVNIFSRAYQKKMKQWLKIVDDVLEKGTVIMKEVNCKEEAKLPAKKL